MIPAAIAGVVVLPAFFVRDQRLVTQLGEERFAELTADGATLGYEDAVALARAELDRVIATGTGLD